MARDADNEDRDEDQQPLPSEFWLQVDAFVQPFEEEWQNGRHPVIEKFLPANGSGPMRHAVLKALVEVDIERRRQLGEQARFTDYLQQYPELAADSLCDTAPTKRNVKGPVAPAASEQPPCPRQIGRYRVSRILGQGGFGVVYLAKDDVLSRLVAIKVPRRALVAGAQDAAPYLEEARTVAHLDHPNIVPVYDVGSTEEHPFFVVSKFIEGSTLAQRSIQRRLSVLDATTLVATVAETLHYAHRKGLFHRDIKPSNILLGSGHGEGDTPIPYVADFGLALKERDIGHGPRFAGTPPYMSPEQARGEGHRVDGRSDLFSLGIVFYELLVGRRPFQGNTTDELLDCIIHMEARPPRQLADIPKELERICLKALTKRASERYATGQDFADDLRLFLKHSTDEEKLAFTSRIAAEPVPPAPPSQPSRPLKVMPPGLRSFEARDGDFFLDLLPGPRDREGLPDSIRFWKTCVEEMDADNTFAVGLIYGPSGCGKSSLVKAGLLPRLSEQVQAVYVEAAAEETETRLLKALRKRCADLPTGLGLKEALVALRCGQGLATGKKVLIILDQFEQWLHVRKDQESNELVEALRQCDGARVQCLIMVRDDFWLAVSRFLRALEIRLEEGKNSVLVDLFDLEHAKKVLAAFGRAFEKLPENPADTRPEQKQFLIRAVTELAREGKVICVRLALFAEMMKSKPWTPASLKAMGGTTGVGATFLEETFSADSAPAEHRHHQKAARGVLKALAPQTGTDIKGHMKSYQELLQASGYASHPEDFTDLVRILDNGLRLITPTDPEGSDESPPTAPAGPASGPAQTPAPGQMYYQLTHDYLVHSLRDWLARKQKETRSGRAEWLLEDLTSTWVVDRKNRHLPYLLQWLQIRLLTRKKRWTAPQAAMMRKATHRYALRGILAVAVFAVSLFVAWQVYGQSRASFLHDQLLKVSTADVTGLVETMVPFRSWLAPRLTDSYLRVRDDPEADKQKLHVSLAQVGLGLMPRDSEQGNYLYQSLLTSDPDAVIAIREALRDYKREELWFFLQNPNSDHDQRLRAACALAAVDPKDERWIQNSPAIAKTLLNQKPLLILQWADALKPIGNWLLPSLVNMLLDEHRNPSERALIAGVYGRFAQAENYYDQLEKVLEQEGSAASEAEKILLRKRKTRFAVALLVMGRPAKVWRLLVHTADPTLRSLLMEELNLGAGIKASLLVARLREEKDDSVRRALLLSLGGFAVERSFLPELMRLYLDDPDPGIHEAAGWLLLRWKLERELAELKGRIKAKVPGSRQRWYINSAGQTMAVMPTPAEFSMGEPGKTLRCRIDHRFAIAAREVTWEEFQKFDPTHRIPKGVDRQAPVTKVSWYRAVAYCNWLNEKDNIARREWCFEPLDMRKYEAGWRVAERLTLMPFTAFANQSLYGAGMRMADGYLRRTGYRLPTEAEWEFACRAGADTTYSFGDAVALLDQYAWYYGNPGEPSVPLGSRRPHPVGTLKPNDFGLFDMHGNAMEWTLDRFFRPRTQTPEGIVDLEDVQDLQVVKKDPRVLRGGSFRQEAGNYIPCGQRVQSRPEDLNLAHGFRVARTMDR